MMFQPVTFNPNDTELNEVIYFMVGDRRTGKFEFNRITGKARLTPYSDSWLECPLLLQRDKVTFDMLMLYLKDNVVPKERINLSEILSAIGLDCYDVWGLTYYYHGYFSGRKVWIHFGENDITKWEDVYNNEGVTPYAFKKQQ